MPLGGNLESRFQAQEDTLFRTDLAGRRLFFLSGMDRPGPGSPDPAAEQEIRRLLGEQRRAVSGLTKAGVFPSIFFLPVLKYVLNRLVGVWASLTITGGVMRTEIVIGSVVVLAVFRIGVTQLKALKVGRNGPTPLSPPSPRPFGPWGGGRKPKAPMGNELRKSYRNYRNRLLQTIAAWPEAPPLHSRPEAVLESDRAEASAMPL